MARVAESSYNSKLRQVARQIDMIVRGLAPDGVATDLRIVQALTRYSEMLEPWAQAVARYMIADVAKRNELAWKRNSNDISKALLAELRYAPTGRAFSELQQQQVHLITSLPIEAAQRVQTLVERALLGGHRADVIAKQILETGSVTKARATLIARTEVSRAASNLTQARAQFVGSTGYIWRSSRDGNVRPTHRKMSGKFVLWTDPPKTDEGLAPYHAGCGPNCRCWPDPVVP
jgi:SPP1 gp7 family putative phage head morphogenesis protein